MKTALLAVLLLLMAIPAQADPLVNVHARIGHPHHHRHWHHRHHNHWHRHY